MSGRVKDIGLIRIAAACFLSALSSFAGAASPVDSFAPGTPYYFDSFDPGQGAWTPGQSLNIEEVFKNYQYYEMVFERGGKRVTVDHYIRGIRAGGGSYLILPDGSLQKEE